jgi:two-component system chemotaxis response regulator CheY
MAWSHDGATLLSDDPKTILTVDDSRTMRDMLRLALAEAGYRVVQAVDGVEGLERLNAEGADVIITDINMPNLDGLGFIERVRSDQRHRATPILVLTTESEPEVKDRARKAGATGWIVKPFDPSKLVDAIRRVAA